jgi:hypothetical protein
MDMTDSIFAKTVSADTSDVHRWLAQLTIPELRWMEANGWDLSNFGQHLLDGIRSDSAWGWVSFNPPKEIEVLWKLSL